ncbi:MAG: NAD(P)/FAD-dependent oxidoreductase [Candidatus Aenigmatarchaeota archaeon]
MMKKEDFDVIIAGGGPAGSTTARECAKNGLKTIVFDRNNEIGTPKRCAEGLSANSVKRLGLKIPSRCIAQEIKGAYVYAPNGKEVKVQFTGTDGYVLERKIFDKWLAAEAAKAGAQIFVKSNVTDVIKDGSYITGVRIETMDGSMNVAGKVVVAADGVESLIMRKAGIRTNKTPTLVDSGFQYEMAGIDIRDPKMIEFFFGNKIAPRGYVWIFPKGKDMANVGIGINGSHKEKTAKQYLDDFITQHDDLKKGSIIEVNAGSIPVGGLMKNMVGNGILGVGDAVNQVNAIHGGGISESITAGKLAGDVINRAITKDDVSSKSLSAYNKIWWKERGEHLKRVEKLREILEKLSDDNFNDLENILTGEDLSELAHGNRIPKLVKIIARMKMRGFKRKIGL